MGLHDRGTRTAKLKSERRNTKNIRIFKIQGGHRLTLILLATKRHRQYRENFIC